MRPMLEKLPVGHFSFNCKQMVIPFLDYPWHYHPDYELTLIEKSEGTRFVGNHIERFKDGDLILLGPNLPHIWKNDEAYYEKNSLLRAHCTVIHFKDNSFGETFFQLPEMENVRRLLQKANRGIKVTGKTRDALSAEMIRLFNEKGIYRILELLSILEKIAVSKDITQLSSPGFCNAHNETDSERMSCIYNYILQNYNKEISLDEIAEKVNMNTTSFCRYFKSRTKKTFTNLVNEIRIGQSCKILIEKDMSISQISFECGYNNLSYFNRQFKKYTGMNAKQYIEHYKMTN
jgi:AraC-like DNA-binding protein